MANYNVVAQYTPGTIGAGCLLCSCTVPRDQGYGQTEAVVDTGVVIDMEGGVAFCESCVKEMARLVGMADPSDVECSAQAASEASALAQEALERAERAEDLAVALLAYAQVSPFGSDCHPDEHHHGSHAHDGACPPPVDAAVDKNAAESGRPQAGKAKAADRAKAGKAS